MQSITDYCIKIFGEKAYRLTIDGGFTCPNRDGSIAFDGCSFCRSGSGDFAQSRMLPIAEQIDLAKSRISSKYKGHTYIAYFQPYTNTYAPVAVLRERFMAAILKKDISGLAIATRPDCLPDDVLLLLDELNQIKPVWVELGLQTMHDSTARAFHRGYETQCYDDAVNRLNACGIHTVTHMILNLPGETPEMMLQTADHIAGIGSGGLKIQMLNILSDTPLAREYLADPFPLFTLDEYAAITADIIHRMPEEMVLHRMTGDGSRRYLIAPLWITDKKRVLNTIRHNLLHSSPEIYLPV